MVEELAPPPRDRKGLRTGFTTGSCATAAAKAAMIALVGGHAPESVTIDLPIGGTATFAPVHWELGEGWASCAVIKDAGDDPDATHGARIHARVAWREGAGITLAGGEGVGTVTLPGLGLEVGGPAINPVPRQMIVAAVTEAADDTLARRGVLVTISVPGGEAIARKTLNGRLGIVGGISILGTWGIVKPYSTASWRASVVQAVQVAAANSQRALVLCTGSRSEKFAMRHFEHLPPLAFVEMGIFTGDALRTCVPACGGSRSAAWSASSRSWPRAICRRTWPGTRLTRCFSRRSVRNAAPGRRCKRRSAPPTPRAMSANWSRPTGSPCRSTGDSRC
jgi:cobalt-precorrin-5B (C1)-methyltransferase